MAFLSHPLPSLMHSTSPSPIYADIEPHFEWVRGEDFDTLLVDVSGFNKNQIKVEVDASRKLKISGEGAILGRWRRFVKDFKIPENCDVRTIRANLDEGILYLTLPKPGTQVRQPEQDHESEGSKQFVGDVREKETDSSPEVAVSDDGRRPENPKQRSGGVVMGICKHKHLIVNVAVAIVVGLYVGLRAMKGHTTNEN